MLTSTGLVDYCKKLQKLPTCYMWGGIARIVSQSGIDVAVKMYPKRYTQERIKYLKSQIGKRYSCDCVGLIKSYIWGGLSSPNYSPSSDYNTTTMYMIASAKDRFVKLDDLHPGYIMYMDGHVGVYIGDGKVIECTYGEYGDGVVETNVIGRGWTHWLKLPMIEYYDGFCNCNCLWCQDGYFMYTVKSGDSWGYLAKKFLGSESRMYELAEYNNMTIYTTIHPGNILYIPIEGSC